MDFSLEYTKEQEEFAKEFREWLDRNTPKDLITPWEPGKNGYEQWQKRRELGRKLGEKGWLYPAYPKEYGGGGLDSDRCFVLTEELVKRGLNLPPYYDSGRLAAPALIACGSEEQKKRLLPHILKGEAVTWQLFTEPEAGTDEANQKTNALRSVREKDYFIVNGGKIFVGGLYAPPEQFLLLTRSDPSAPRHENLAMFLAPGNSPGITILPLDLFISGQFVEYSTTGIDTGPRVKHQVFLDDVKVHESYLIGGERDGWKVANAALRVEHGGGRGISHNIAAEKFLRQCKTNPTILRRLRENPTLLSNVVNVYVDSQIERLLSMRNVWLGSSGRRVVYAGTQIHLYTKMFGGRIVADMAKVLGPYAFTNDDKWGLEEGRLEVAERAGLCFAPAGTPEAQKINLSRAFGIGRA